MIDAMETGFGEETMNTDGFLRRTTVLPGGKVKRVRNRFGGELGYTERASRHESRRDAAENRADADRREACRTLSEELDDLKATDTTPAGHEQCSYSGDTVVEDQTSYTTGDGRYQVIIVRRGTRITGAHISPLTRRYYY